MSFLGRGSGQVLAHNSNDSSSNPDKAGSFSVKFVFKTNESNQKDPGNDPIKNIETCR